MGLKCYLNNNSLIFPLCYSNIISLKTPLLYIFIILFTFSCKTKKDTLNTKELIKIWNLESATGVKYFKHDNKWYTEKSFDSLITVSHDSVINDLKKQYPKNE